MTFLGVLLLGCMATSWLQQGSTGSKPELQQPLVHKQLSYRGSKESRAKTIEVYVSGAVREPGIYTLPAGARTTEALEAAGGLRPDAKAERVNLAKKLRDGSHVYVPVEKGSRPKAKEQLYAGSSTKAASKAGAGVDAAGFGGASEDDWGLTGTAQSKLNLNTATQQQLIALPGIGPSMANRILALRRVRRFTKVEDLLQVRGIGQAKLERLRPYVRVD